MTTTSNAIHVDNVINEAVRALYAEGITPNEMKDSIDRIVADISDQATRRLYVQQARERQS